MWVFRRQTGRFTSHTGVGPNVIKPSAPYAVPKNETFLPELLKEAGYAVHPAPPPSPLVVLSFTH
jgi:arylsulfatase A-like enzyme